jgi:hypothetical protein
MGEGPGRELKVIPDEMALPRRLRDWSARVFDSCSLSEIFDLAGHITSIAIRSRAITERLRDKPDSE